MKCIFCHEIDEFEIFKYICVIACLVDNMMSMHGNVKPRVVCTWIIIITYYKAE